MTRKALLGLLVVAVLAFGRGATGQDTPMKVKGGHVLGETAEQFFTEGQEKEVFEACASRDFKKLPKEIRSHARKYCADLADTRMQAMSGARLDYQGNGDPSEVRKDTFTFDSGHLVKVELIYSIPSAELNYQGLTFEQIFAGVKQAYGPPSNESTKPVQDTYGVRYETHRELWLAPHTAILITEQPWNGGSTTLDAFTRGEYDRAMAGGEPKPANPLE